MKTTFCLLTFLSWFSTTILITPINAQQFRVSRSATQNLAMSNDADDVDIDFNNYPVPIKYAHGFKKHPIGHLPVPANPEACKRYVQAQELRDKGVVYLYHCRYSKAIQRLNQSELLWPDSASTYRWLAEAYDANGQTQEAIANYRLLFYGWPGKSAPNLSSDDALPKIIPADKPSDYDQLNPEETDPTLLLCFSLLLQQTNQYTEAQSVYNQGIQALLQKFPNKETPTPLASTDLVATSTLEAATRTALAIDELSYQNKSEAVENLKQALRLQPDFALADNYLKKSTE